MTLSSTLRTALRRAGSLMFVGLLPLLNGGWIYGPQSTFETHGPVAKTQLDVFYVTLWVTMIIFVLVAAVLTYATLRFRVRPGDSANQPPPEQSHGNPLIELGLIVLSIAALVVIAVPTMRAIWYTYDVPEAERANAYEVTATGYQWWFKFEYPKEQIEGSGALVTGNELVIPAGRPVRVNLRTVDVIHSFWVPKLAGKVDMMPNRGNHLWLKADEPGYFWGQCAEFCGESHAVMRFRVIALSEPDFAAWVAQQKNPARTVPGTQIGATPPVASPRVEFASYKYERQRPNAPGWSEGFDRSPFAAWQQKQQVDAGENPELIAQGRKLFIEKKCAGCHAVRGHEGAGISGPDLTRIGSRTTIAGGLLENTEQNLHRWLTEPNNVKPGNKMWFGGYVVRNSETGVWEEQFSINDGDARALVAYLHSLK
jgi:cytochrome c oxidase subunit 2